jgi:pimeloyl-ACP methyl ester carboxylesterase
MPYVKVGQENLDLVVIEGGSHAVPRTHADQVNSTLVKFLA